MHFDGQSLLAAGLLANFIIKLIEIFVAKPDLDCKLEKLRDALSDATSALTGLKPK